MRILQVIPTYYPATRYGGPIRSVHGLSTALAARGHDVHVYTTDVDGKDNSDVDLARPVDLDGVHVHYFPCRRGRRLYWSPRMRRALRRDVAGFDIVHTHSVFLWPTWTAAKEAARARVPYLVSPRGMLVPELIARRSRLFKTAWLRLVERRALAEADGLHVTTELEARDARRVGLRLPPAFCVPNGLHVPAATGEIDASHGESYALFLGRISWKKGLDRLIRAWRHVPSLPLVIAGNDEENLTPRLRELAETEGVAARVRFAGPVDDASKWPLYRHARLFVLPSYSENFGNVVLEALAVGCPVVLTPEVGLADRVLLAGAGVVVNGAPEPLGAAIRNLNADAAARNRMGEAGRVLVNAEFSWPAVAARMEDVYGEIRSRRGLPRAGLSLMAEGA